MSSNSYRPLPKEPVAAALAEAQELEKLSAHFASVEAQKHAQRRLDVKMGGWPSLQVRCSGTLASPPLPVDQPGLTQWQPGRCPSTRLTRPPRRGGVLSVSGALTPCRHYRGAGGIE